jgi:glutamate racemase
MSRSASAARPIGVFDSGVGGLSIVRQLRLQLPGEDVLFLADQAHVPYGLRALNEVQEFSVAITRFLLGLQAKLIVVACNTASAAALHHLRREFPGIPFVGMEPAVKPAAEMTRTRRVGVLATPATFQGELFASVVERFASGVEVLPVTLPGLVERIESGDLDGPETRRIVEQALRPLLQQGVDSLVLACTHYPFVIPLIEDIAGQGVRVIDPSPAIARQASRLLDEQGLRSPQGSGGELRLLSTTDGESLLRMARQLIDADGIAMTVHWATDRLSLDRLSQT